MNARKMEVPHDGLEEQLTRSVYCWVTIYRRHGPPVSQILRKFDHDSITLDSPTGTYGGLTIRRRDITAVMR